MIKMKLVYVTGPGRKTVHMLDESTRLTFCKRDIWHIRDFDPQNEEMQNHSSYLAVCKACQKAYPNEYKAVQAYIDAHPRINS